MKIMTSFLLGMALVLPAVNALASAVAPVAKVGVYDSRAVAYAHFWSAPARQERDALVAHAKAAREAGDTRRAKELASKLAAAQKQSHLVVFSMAGASAALAALADRLPAIRQEIGVTRLVSKGDKSALKAVPESDRVDATDRLVREFLPSPTEQQVKTIAALQAAKPLPLWQVKLMNLLGGG